MPCVTTGIGKKDPELSFLERFSENFSNKTNCSVSIMSAYVIFLENVVSAELLVENRRVIIMTLEPFDGKFIVRGGRFIAVEGDWPYQRIVVIEFSSRQLEEA
jgi:hypothetical protein